MKIRSFGVARARTGESGGGRLARRLALAGAVVASVAMAGIGMPAASAQSGSAPALVKDPASLVNPFIGTGSGGATVGQVDLFPGAAVPFGMLTFSPDTPSRPDGGGYNYSDSSTLGFSLTHISGPGCPAFGDVPILPTVGAIGSNPAGTTEPFSHAHEQATPGYYGVTLAPGTPSAIKTELSATTRSGIAKFHFPSTKAANVLFKAGDSQNGNSAADLHIVGNNEVTGSATSGHFCGSPGTYTVHFAAVFNRPFSSYGTWNGTTVSPSSTAVASHGPQHLPIPAPPAASKSASSSTGATNGIGRHHESPAGAPSQPRTQVPGTSGPSSGGWVSFNTTSGSSGAQAANTLVRMKVAISYVSTADAMANLRAEDPGWSLSAVKNKAHQEWNKLLSRIEVGGGTHSEQVQFYTGLYHALLDPNVFSDVNGKYIGFDNKVHQLPPGQVQYANFSGWDIYRSEVPLLAMMAPHRTSQMMSSLVNDQAQGGWLPKWPLANDYTGVMNGDAADPILAGAYAFGARAFNTKAALTAMVKGATVVPTSSQLGQGWYSERPGLAQYMKLGYVPNNASETLEYAVADFGISRLARALGMSSTEKTFFARSQNWQNIFDSAASYGGFSGYMEPRASNGAFPSGSAFSHSGFGQPGFQEGNTVQYSWMVPQDLHGLFGAMGGNSTVVARLNALFTHLNVGPNQPYYWAGNEPGLEIPWEYDYAGAPYQTQAIVHRILTSVYSNTPGGEPGNDDLGAMSSWLVWSYMGMYPVTPGASVLALGAPVFPRISFHLANGHILSLSAPGASTSTYVQSLTVNGKPWNNDWLPASMVTGPGTTTSASSGSANASPSGKGGATTLAFSMGPNPNKAWAASQSEEPPSYPAGPVQLPVNAYLSTSPDPGAVSPGSSSTETLTLNNSQDKSSLGVHWTATASGSISVAPSSGTLSAGAGSNSTVDLTISAPAGATKGFADLTVGATASDGSSLPPVTTPVAVAPQGSILRQYNNVGIADASHPACGAFDSSSLQGAYSQSTLDAVGLSPGATVRAGGANFTWPDVSTCQPDNVKAAGQTLQVHHAATGVSQLAFLGAGGNGNASGPIKINYTDGTSSSATLGFSDWALGGGSESPQYGNQIVATLPRRYEGGGPQTLKMYVFEQSVPVDPAKTVASVTLPQSSQVSGGGSLHVFAVAEDSMITSPNKLVVSPGGAATLSVGAMNPGSTSETVAWSVGTPPSGITVSPSSGSLSVAPGATATSKVTVSAAASTQQGFYSLNFTEKSGSTTLGTAQVTVVVATPGSLVPEFNNVGITSNSAMANGNYDGDGNSYSAQALAAQGLTPGGTFSAGGVKLTWPAVAAGTPDNIAASGQVVPLSLPSGATKLVVVGSVANGPSYGSATITYADGSTQQVQLGLSDWTLNGGSATSASFGNGTVASMPYRNMSSGSSQSVKTYVFSTAITLNSTSPVSSITLPTSTNNGGVIHVFAMGG